MRRRHFFLLPAVLRAQPRPPSPWRFFTAAEARIVRAATNRIFPSDASGPGAEEAGVVPYIDRQLAGPYGRDRYRFTQGPFLAGTPQQGYQGADTPRLIYRQALAQLKDLPSLPPTQQDARLAAIEKTYFFQLLRQHTLEGLFADPMHGGNRNLAGWRLIGFPGPYMSWFQDLRRHDGRAFRPTPKSLAQVLGHPVIPWEQREP